MLAFLFPFFKKLNPKFLRLLHPFGRDSVTTIEAFATVTTLRKGPPAMADITKSFGVRQ